MDSPGLVNEFEALLAAIEGAPRATQRVIADQLILRLRERAPGTARVVGAVLAATLSDEVAGAKVRRSLGELSEPDLVGRGVPDVEPPRTDCLVLTIKENELIAVLEAFEIPPGTPADFYLGSTLMYRVAHGGRNYVIACVGEEGNVETSVLLLPLLIELNPRSAALVGMAAGLKGEVEHGDVIVAHDVWAYDFEKLTREGPVLVPKPINVDRNRFEGLSHLRRNAPEWYADVWASALALQNPVAIPEAVLKVASRRVPKHKIGGLLAGSDLIEDGSLQDTAGKVHGEVIGAEMEGAGFAMACKRRQVPFLVLRGVADFGIAPKRGKRPKYWQVPATYVAARLLRDGLERKWLNLDA